MAPQTGWASLLRGSPLQTSVRMTRCGNEGAPKDSAIDFFTTEKKNSTHYVPCKIACANCRSPMFDEVRQRASRRAWRVLTSLLKGRNTVLCYPSAFNFGPDRPMPEGFKAKCHIFYGSRTVDMIDGLPKWSGHKDSSEIIPETSETAE